MVEEANARLEETNARARRDARVLGFRRKEEEKEKPRV